MGIPVTTVQRACALAVRFSRLAGGVRATVIQTGAEASRLLSECRLSVCVAPFVGVLDGRPDAFSGLAV